MITGLLVYAVTYLTTHHALFNIMQIEMFNRKPFSCWLCSNTWLGLFIFINLAYIFNPFYLLWGIIVIFLTGYAIVRG
jgi:hypothetical protein